MAASPKALARLQDYLQAMLQRNKKINLTAIREPEMAQVLHLQDSLAMQQCGLKPETCLDLGSGNGFPGVAMRVLFPKAQVCLLERTQKKVLAMRELIHEAGLLPLEVLHMDANQAASLRPELRRHFDLVTARALAEPSKVARMASPLTRTGGKLLLWLDTDAEVSKDLPGFFLHKVWDYELPAPAARQRRLASYERQP